MRKGLPGHRRVFIFSHPGRFCLKITKKPLMAWKRNRSHPTPPGAAPAHFLLLTLELSGAGDQGIGRSTESPLPASIMASAFTVILLGEYGHPQIRRRGPYH